jgi:transposase
MYERSLLIECLLPAASQLHFEAFTQAAEQLTLVVSSIQREVICPYCQQTARRIHSHYRRTVADVAWAGWPVQFHLQVRRFYCSNPCCTHRTFVERLPSVVAPFARRTVRLAQTQATIGLALGGEAGARLAQQQGMPVSPDTLLRLVRQLPLPSRATPRILAVDDWAKRKGKSYGTVLVDLERHQVVELLPERTVEALAKWLQAHPGVEVIVRDRSTTYADGARQGAPTAIQVADRWHLLKNLVETVEHILARHKRQLQRFVPAPTALPTAEQRPVPAVHPGIPGAQAERLRLQRRAVRLARYQQLLVLREQGLTLHEIAHRLGISKRTVNRFVAAGAFRERKRRHTKKPGLLAAYTTYLEQRWAEGCHNGTQLWRELRGQGFQGSLAIVLDSVTQLRHGGPAFAAQPGQPERVVRRYSPRQAAVFFLRPPAELTETEQRDVMQMTNASPVIATTYALAQRFALLIRHRCATALDPWLAAAKTAALTEFKQFATGLERDKAAVLAALQLPWSNGQTEGQVNRLKLLKRQMYGRANFDLLRQRVLAA